MGPPGLSAEYLWSRPIWLISKDEMLIVLYSYAAAMFLYMKVKLRTWVRDNAYYYAHHALPVMQLMYQLLNKNTIQISKKELTAKLLKSPFDPQTIFSVYIQIPEQHNSTQSGQTVSPMPVFHRQAMSLDPCIGWRVSFPSLLLTHLMFFKNGQEVKRKKFSQ